MTRELLSAAPKAELHLHFHWSIRPETLLELASRHRIDLPVQNVVQLREWFRFRDFAHFVEVYATLRSCLLDAADYELVTYELGAQLGAHNVRYAEVAFTPGPEVYRGPRETFFDGLTRGRLRVLDDFGVDLRWIFDIPRRTVTLHPDLPLKDFITPVAIDGRTDGVVALGLGGTEAGHPPEAFERWFDQARAAGLHSAPHAGETAGPESMWGAQQRATRRLRLVCGTSTGRTGRGRGREPVEDGVLKAFEASFLPEAQRQAMLAAAQHEIQQLRGAALQASRALN